MIIITGTFRNISLPFKLYEITLFAYYKIIIQFTKALSHHLLMMHKLQMHETGSIFIMRPEIFRHFSQHHNNYELKLNREMKKFT